MALKLSGNYEGIRLLLDRGADACRENIACKTPLHSYFNEAIGQFIQRHQDDVDFDATDHMGMTVLHWASWSERSMPEHFACRTAPKSHPRFLTRDNFGESLLHYAVQKGNIRVVKYLMSQPYAADMALPDYEGSSLLHYASASGCVHLIDFLIDCKGFDPMLRDNFGGTLLHSAAAHGKLDAVKHLFHRGIAQPDALDQYGRTALQLALSRQSMTLNSMTPGPGMSHIPRSMVEYIQAHCDASVVEQLGNEEAEKVHVNISVQSTKRDVKALSLVKATMLALLFPFLYWCQLRTISNSRLS
jgi:ankyrin repeat protein